MKKGIYAVIGAVFVLAAIGIQRVDGGGGDTFLLTLLGIGLLFASANVSTNRRVTP